MPLNAAAFDRIVNDPRFTPYRGWHADYGPGKEYLPAVQQDRVEFLALVKAIERHGLSGGSALQIGLGHAGGAHSLFRAIFTTVLTIEVDLGLADQYIKRFPELAGTILVGDSRSDSIIAQAAKRAPYDFLFIDGGHSREEVAADARAYGPLIRLGGIVAFHDAVQHGQNGEIGVHIFLDELREAGVKIDVVGEIGTAWLVKDEGAFHDLQPLPARAAGGSGAR